MRNEVVYRMTNESILSIDMMRSRWKMFGHALHMEQDTPAHKAMLHYFAGSRATRFRGTPRVNMPWKLDQDLKKFAKDMGQLKSLDDLHVLEGLANRRKRWTNMLKKMCAAAKAEKNA